MTNIKTLQHVITLVIASLLFSACASSPEPVSEISPDEPVIVANEQVSEPYEPPANEQFNEPYDPASESVVLEPIEPIEPATDMAMNEDSSGIAPPAEDIMMEEPAPAPMEADNATMATAISEVPAGHYGIQIVAASTMENLKAFASKHGIADNLSTTILLDGKEWYVLLQGTYATLEEAKAALDGIQGQYTTSPWIRKISSLQ